MKVSIATRGMEHQRRWGLLLEEGLAAWGVAPVRIDAGAAVTTKVVACWGWRVGETYRAKGHEVLVAERGYIGDRFEWTSLGWNGLNGRADFGVVRGGLRRGFGVPVQPWRPVPGGPLRVLMLGQVRGDMALRGAGVNYEAWLAETARRIRAAGHMLLWRPHPKDQDLTIAADRAPGTLEDAFAATDIAVTFNSNSATDAVMAGLPCLTGDMGAMAWAVTARPGEGPIAPDRTDWLRRMSWCQWSDEEIATGAALAHIFERRGDVSEAA